MPVILIQEGLPLWREVQVLAHELGHLLAPPALREAVAMEEARAAR